MAKLTIDEAAATLTIEDGEGRREMPLYSDEAFAHVARQYVRVGWNQKHSYTFTWFGRPVIQLPEDMLRIQEVIHQVRPTLIVETGVAHGGSLIYYASLFEAMGRGRVVGVDIEIRPHNRTAIEAHPLFSRIDLIEGGATEPAIVDAVRAHVTGEERVMVILDSNHSYDHVAAELALYADFVTPGSYIVATDGIMRDVADVPKGEPGWRTDNPANAAEDFAATRDDFELAQPDWAFNESGLTGNITYWPSAYLRRKG